MKFRTDFVTNSSSSSYVCCVVELKDRRRFYMSTNERVGDSPMPKYPKFRDPWEVCTDGESLLSYVWEEMRMAHTGKDRWGNILEYDGAPFEEWAEYPPFAEAVSGFSDLSQVKSVQFYGTPGDAEAGFHRSKQQFDVEYVNPERRPPEFPEVHPIVRKKTTPNAKIPSEYHPFRGGYEIVVPAEPHPIKFVFEPSRIIGQLCRYIDDSEPVYPFSEIENKPGLDFYGREVCCDGYDGGEASGLLRHLLNAIALLSDEEVLTEIAANAPTKKDGRLALDRRVVTIAMDGVFRNFESYVIIGKSEQCQTVRIEVKRRKGYKYIENDDFDGYVVAVPYDAETASEFCARHADALKRLGL